MWKFNLPFGQITRQTLHFRNVGVYLWMRIFSSPAMCCQSFNYIHTDFFYTIQHVFDIYLESRHLCTHDLSEEVQVSSRLMFCNASEQIWECSALFHRACCPLASSSLFTDGRHHTNGFPKRLNIVVKKTLLVFSTPPFRTPIMSSSANVWYILGFLP